MSHSASAKTVHVAVAEGGGGVNFCPTLLVMSFFLPFFSFSYLFCVWLYLVISFILYAFIPTFFISPFLSSVCIISFLTPTS